MQPTQEQFDRAKDRMTRELAKWKNILPLELWHIEHTYHWEPWETRGKALAETFADWRYWHATIKWYVPELIDILDGPDADEQFEKYAVHELTHCLLDCMTQYAVGTYGDGKMDSGQIEQTVTVVAQALQWTHTAGWNAAKESMEPDVYEQMSRAISG